MPHWETVVVLDVCRGSSVLESSCRFGTLKDPEVFARVGLQRRSPRASDLTVVNILKEMADVDSCCL
jgi:hypothetical protein